MIIECVSRDSPIQITNTAKPYHTLNCVSNKRTKGLNESAHNRVFADRLVARTLPSLSQDWMGWATLFGEEEASPWQQEA